MKKLISILFILFAITVSSQNVVDELFRSTPEIIFEFQAADKERLNELGRHFSIDKVQDDRVTAYANRKEFEYFLTLDIPYKIVEKPLLSPEELNMMDVERYKNSRNDWNSYPTYETYETMMAEFETNYPEICKIINFGTTVQNRNLLACKISKNVNQRESEPQVFWSSTMHGDETTGYALMLRFIDYLLANYGTNERVTHLLDNMEIWINPLANPDGTYRSGNHTVSGSIRYNANYVDLNRNYKDWRSGDHPDGNDWQKETKAFMDLQEDESFVLGVNIHGGAEVCNYPWDNTTARHADDSWWKFVCREYADTAHLYAPSGYMDYLQNGITNGSDWYQIGGGRQDYANYYDHCREFCLEISDTKNPVASQLPNFWNYNYRSFLNYTEQALYGIHGAVTDQTTREPLSVKITIKDHDKDNSFVMTDERVGYYVRPIKAGVYSVIYSADGYISDTVDITISDREKIIQNIALYPEGAPVCNFEADATAIKINESVKFTDLSQNEPVSWRWYFEGGTPEISTESNPTVKYETEGDFDVKLVISNEIAKDSLLKEGYIIVRRDPMPPVADFEADQTIVYPGDRVAFTDLSQNPLSWEWTFEGGFPATSAEQNPVVTYNISGEFTVSLTVHNNDGSDEMVKEKYISVPVKIHEPDEISHIKVFPNPVRKGDVINVESKFKIKRIDMMNIAGQVLQATVVEGNDYLFTTSQLERGLYLMKIHTETGANTIKIQIQ